MFYLCFILVRYWNSVSKQSIWYEIICVHSCIQKGKVLKTECGIRYLVRSDYFIVNSEYTKEHSNRWIHHISEIWNLKWCKTKHTKRKLAKKVFKTSTLKSNWISNQEICKRSINSNNYILSKEENELKCVRIAISVSIYTNQMLTSASFNWTHLVSAEILDNFHITNYLRGLFCQSARNIAS